MEKTAEFVPSFGVDLRREVNICLGYPLCSGGNKEKDFPLKENFLKRENSFLTL